MIKTSDNIPESSYPEMDRILRDFPCSRDLLIEILHAAQQRFGYLDEALLAHIACHLDLPPSLVYGVATFYHSFRLQPSAPHHCTVCLGTSCHIRGGTTLMMQLEQRLSIAAGTTDRERGITLDSVRCLGTCGMAPLAVLNGVIIGGSTAEEVADEICRLLKPSGKEREAGP